MSDKTKNPAVDSPPPGSREALLMGCNCAVLDNAHGKGWMCISGVYWMREDCPLHGRGNGGEPGEESIRRG